MPKKKNGPGKSYRVGISSRQFYQMFPDEQSAQDWIEE